MKRVGLLLAILLLSGGTAFAAPTATERDRADNSFSFRYNADTGKMPFALSGTTTTRRDKVSFFAYARERDGKGEGKRLLGLVTLRLVANEPVAYDGVFTYSVLNTSGQTAFQSSKSRKIVLRPKKGKRTARLRFVYDLPSGDYSLNATFNQE